MLRVEQDPGSSPGAHIHQPINQAEGPWYLEHYLIVSALAVVVWPFALPGVYLIVPTTRISVVIWPLDLPLDLGLLATRSLFDSAYYSDNRSNLALKTWCLGMGTIIGIVSETNKPIKSETFNSSD